MQHNDIYLIIHHPFAYNLCLSNFQFVSLNQKPTDIRCIKILNTIFSLLSLGTVIDHTFQILIDCVGVSSSFS